MKQIRTSVFETNSSSTHSITIDKNNIFLDSLEMDENGVVILTEVRPDYESWEFVQYRSAKDKASYLAGDVWNRDDEDGILKKEMLIKVIKEQTGATGVVFIGNNGGFVYEAWLSEYDLKKKTYGYANLDEEEQQIILDIYNNYKDLL